LIRVSFRDVACDVLFDDDVFVREHAASRVAKRHPYRRDAQTET